MDDPSVAPEGPAAASVSNAEVSLAAGASDAAAISEVGAPQESLAVTDGVHEDVSTVEDVAGADQSADTAPENGIPVESEDAAGTDAMEVDIGGEGVPAAEKNGVDDTPHVPSEVMGVDAETGVQVNHEADSTIRSTETAMSMVAQAGDSHSNSPQTESHGMAVKEETDHGDMDGKGHVVDGAATSQSELAAPDHSTSPAAMDEGSASEAAVNTASDATEHNGGAAAPAVVKEEASADTPVAHSDTSVTASTVKDKIPPVDAVADERAKQEVKLGPFSVRQALQVCRCLLRTCGAPAVLCFTTTKQVALTCFAYPFFHVHV